MGTLVPGEWATKPVLVIRLERLRDKLHKKKDASTLEALGLWLIQGSPATRHIFRGERSMACT